ncbi:MAG: hypothetical protein ACOX27_03030 [Caldicoprobacterales bacterium]
MDNIEIKFLRYPKLAKCSSCGRVRDIYFKALIYDVDDRKSVVGDLDLCKLCGENLHKAAGNDKGRPGRWRTDCKDLQFQSGR